MHYDVIIIDECEQVLAHLLSDTIEERSAGRRALLFESLMMLLKQAKCVVAADADLGWLTFETFSRIIQPALPDPTQGDLFDLKRPGIRLRFDDRKLGRGRTVYVFRSKHDLIDDMRQTARDGKRLYVTANTKLLVDQLAALLINGLPELKLLVITADTMSNESQQAFLRSPTSEALQYDVILTSPAVGTGVDITFENCAQCIDVVYGFCEPNVTTHLEFDQQLSRVRHPAALKVWVTPRRFQYETNRDAVRRELFERHLKEYLLVDVNKTIGDDPPHTDDALIEMASLRISEQRASQNALQRHFVDYKEAQGFTVEWVETSEECSKIGRELLATGRSLSRAQYVAAVTEARSLRRDDSERIRAAIEGGQIVARVDWWAYQRTRLELFYRSRITAELVAFDDRGRQRTRIMLLDEVERSMADSSHGSAGNALDRRTQFLRTSADIVDAIAKLIRLTPLWSGASWDTEIEIDGHQLGDFIRFIRANKAAIENLLDLDIRGDLAVKPVQQLNRVLKMIGLRLVVARKSKSAGRRTYHYRLDSQGLASIRAVQRARSTTGAWRRLAEIHGWQNRDDTDEDELDDAA
jgi:hypothetical protein